MSDALLLQAINPKLLIFVEGTCGNNYPVEYTNNIGGYWWGGMNTFTQFGDPDALEQAYP